MEVRAGVSAVEDWLEARFSGMLLLHRLKKHWGVYWLINYNKRSFAIGATYRSLQKAATVPNELQRLDSNGGFDDPPQLPEYIFFSSVGSSVVAE